MLCGLADVRRMHGVQALEAQVRATEGTNAGLRAELQAGHEAFEGAKAEVRRDENQDTRAERARRSINSVASNWQCFHDPG